MEYKKIMKELAIMPKTFILGILHHMILLCIKKNVFKDFDALQKYIKNAIDGIKKNRT